MSFLQFSPSDNTALVRLYKYVQLTSGIRFCLFPDLHFAQITFSVDLQWAWASSHNKKGKESLCINTFSIEKNDAAPSIPLLYLSPWSSSELFF